MFEFINDFSIIILEVICCKIFFDAFIEEIDNLGREKSYLLVLIQSICLYMYAEFIDNNIFVFKEAAVILTIALLMKFFSGTKTRKTIAVAFLFQCVLLIIDYVTYQFIIILMQEIDLRDVGNIVASRLFVIIGKTVLFFCVLTIKRLFKRRRGVHVIETDWIRFAFCPVFTILASVAMIVAFNDIDDIRQADVLYVIAFGLVVMNIFIYFLVDDIIERERRLAEYELADAQSKTQIDIYNTLSLGLERQRQYAHEFKNHMICIESLIKENDYDTLKEYIAEIGETSYDINKVIDTNNVIVNTILNEKYNEMIDKGIVFVFKINDLSGIFIENEDLVVILSNLLNNAIEACEKCEKEKHIKLKFLTEDNLLILSVKNTIGEAVIYENGEYKTSKLFYKDEHGLGIKNIIRTVEKYGGTYTIKVTDNEFYFAIMFSLK